MKEIFKQEPTLSKRLDQYKVTIPKQRLSQKLGPHARLIRYLASPAHNPFERLIDSTNGYLLLKAFPLACAIVFALLQSFIL